MAELAPGADPRLARLAELLDAHRGAAELVDARWRLVWVSEELQTLYGSKDYADLGLGAHLLEARVRGPTLSPAGRELWLRTNLPLMVDETEGGKQAIAGMLSPGLSRVVDEIEPAAPPPSWASSFEFHRGDFSGRINYIAQRVRHEDGRPLGYLFLYTPDVPASVQTLMLRGDRPMYERMAALVEPRTRPGAILFGDLEASGTLSRQLPSVAYFRLIRALRGELESEVGRRGGILGKHAGDGVTAFFLSEQLGSDAEAALETALALARRTEETASALIADDLPVKPRDILLNVGAHLGRHRLRRPDRRRGPARGDRPRGRGERGRSDSAVGAPRARVGLEGAARAPDRGGPDGDGDRSGPTRIRAARKPRGGDREGDPRRRAPGGRRPPRAPRASGPRLRPP